MEINLSTITRSTLLRARKVHFVGIGGIGISAIARMMLLEGKTVTGSDTSLSEITEALSKAGATITHDQKIESIPKDADLIVYSIAIDEYDKEFFAAMKALPIASKSYPEMLHVVTEGKYTIAITGTHGKTTTTAMIGEMLLGLGKDPSIIVGSLLNPSTGASTELSRMSSGQEIKTKSNLVVGKSDLFVVEGCEYRRSFLNISPKILVITNIEPDHLDYYKDIGEIEKAFCEMMAKVPNDGAIILNKKELEKSTVLVQCYTEAMERGVRVLDYMEYLDQVPHLKIPGLHNKKNAACALAVADVLGLDPVSEHGAPRDVLSAFSGTWRRFDFKGTTSNGVLVYDDYAHHPTEIMATLAGARELFHDKKITVIFQPHLFSRTKSLFKEFSESFKDADEIILLPIYKAREVDDGTVSSKQLAEEMKKNGKNVLYFDTKEEVLAYLKEKTSPNDVVMTMGAGDVYHIGETFLSQEGKSEPRSRFF